MAFTVSSTRTFATLRPLAQLHRFDDPGAVPLAAAWQRSADTPGTATPWTGRPTDDAKGEQASLVADDDLTLILGIGRELNATLLAAGISTYAELARRDLAELSAFTAAVGLDMILPCSWPEQATLAAEGRWAELYALQRRLREVGRRERAAS